MKIYVPLVALIFVLVGANGYSNLEEFMTGKRYPFEKFILGKRRPERLSSSQYVDFLMGVAKRVPGRDYMDFITGAKRSPDDFEAFMTGKRIPMGYFNNP